MLVGGKCTDLVGWPIRGGQAWLKNLSISEGMLRRFNWSMVFSTTFGHVHTSYVVYVHEGKCIDLVGWPIRGGQVWLKNLTSRCGHA